VNRKRSQLQAYFAGLFDGEGFVGPNGPDRNSISVVIGMCDPRAVGLIWREYPEARLYLRPAKPGTKLMYVARFNYYNAYNFLRDIRPFSLVKREQINVALAFLAHRRRDHLAGKHLDSIGRRNGFNCNGRCDALLQKLYALKKSDPKGVNSVNLYELREYRAKPEEVALDVEIISTKLRELLEGVETRVSESNKPISAPEKEIVQAA